MTFIGMSGGCARRRRVLLIFTAAGLGSAASAATWRGPVAKNLVNRFAETLATDALRPSERTFLEKAAALSREEIRLARLAVSQATGSEVKALAQQIAIDHQQINDAVEGLRRKKGAVEEASVDVVSESSQKLAQKNGADFDREFVRLIADTHSEAVMLFERSMSVARDSDVRDLLGAYLPVLRDHQNKISELRKALE